MRIITFLACFIVLSIVGCTNKSDTQKIKSVVTKQSVTQSNEPNNQGELKKSKFDFNDYSSEGGFINAYYSKEHLEYFEVYLLGERGKVLYKFEPTPEKQISVLRTEFTYDKSISEGDVKIANEKREQYLLVGTKTYQITDGKKIDIQDSRIGEMFNAATSTIEKGSGQTQ
jgi:hypothetical protein